MLQFHFVPKVSTEISIEDFKKLQLVVGQIESAQPVEKSQKLLKLQVNLGFLGKRQIISGIAQFYDPEELVGKKIVVVANLKPAKIFGERSEGMLLAVTSDNKVFVLEANKRSEPGSFVT